MKNSGKSIKEFFNIVSIRENYIELFSKNVVIFVVKPFNIKTNKEKEKQLITTMYKQFLDLYLDEFQILILNRNLNVSNYFNKKNKESSSLENEYENQLQIYLKKKIMKTEIISEEYYFIASFEKNKNSIDAINDIYNKLSVLKQNGIDYKILKNKQIYQLLKTSFFIGDNG